MITQLSEVEMVDIIRLRYLSTISHGWSIYLAERRVDGAAESLQNLMLACIVYFS